MGGAKLIANTKLDRLKSAMPARERQIEDTESDVSDPEIKRLKRKAGV